MTSIHVFSGIAFRSTLFDGSQSLDMWCNIMPFAMILMFEGCSRKTLNYDWAHNPPYRCLPRGHSSNLHTQIVTLLNQWIRINPIPGRQGYRFIPQCCSGCRGVAHKEMSSAFLTWDLHVFHRQSDVIPAAAPRRDMQTSYPSSC